MKEKVEMPDKNTVLAVARKCPDAEEVLKGLFPEAFEEEKKEIELESGQIYEYGTSNTYYLLTCFAMGEWTLTNLDSKNSYWCYKNPIHLTINMIKKHFTLCPDATITVKENDC